MTPVGQAADRLERLGPETLARLRAVAAAAEGQAWLVGGVVRDLLLDRDGFDLDLVVGIPAADVARRLDAELLKSTRFLTVTIRWPDGLTWDLATARAESYPEPASLPVVRPGTLDEDLARRDFSVNAMALALDSERWGELVDPCGGLDDLAAKRIRSLHPGSFIDDPTRLFRAIRYAVRLGFGLDEETSRAYWRGLPGVARLTPDRVRHELERSLSEPRALDQTLALYRLGLSRSLDCGLVTEESFQVPILDRLGGTVWVHDHWPGEPLELWLVWLMALVPTREFAPVAARLIQRLALSRVQSQALETVAAYCAARIGTDTPNSRVFRLLEGQPQEAWAAVAARGDHARCRVLACLSELAAPLLTGDDLLAVGYPQGPLIGQILTALRDARLDGRVRDREDEWQLARRVALGLKR